MERNNAGAFFRTFEVFNFFCLFLDLVFVFCTDILLKTQKQLNL